MTPADKLAAAVAKWQELVKEFDGKVGRAAALHNITEYSNLRGHRDGIQQCIESLQPILAELQRAPSTDLVNQIARYITDSQYYVNGREILEKFGKKERV